ncbi:MAG: metal-dependent hydrolase [Candidatus Hodarchaeales archaeon]|jgi:inner membrane protein
MNRDEHMIIGFFIGILVGVLGSTFAENFDFILYVFFVGLTVLGSFTPDLIEPPRSKNHRKFFHSIVLLGFLVILLVWANIGIQSMQTYLFSGFIIGYLSHLLLDATSQMSLPIY